MATDQQSVATIESIDEAATDQTEFVRIWLDAIAIAGNPAVLNVVPVQWRGIISIAAGAVVAYYVKESRPAPSAVDTINQQQ